MHPAAHQLEHDLQPERAHSVLQQERATRHALQQGHAKQVDAKEHRLLHVTAHHVLHFQELLKIIVNRALVNQEVILNNPDQAPTEHPATVVEVVLPEAEAVLAEAADQEEAAEEGDRLSVVRYPLSGCLPVGRLSL